MTEEVVAWSTTASYTSESNSTGEKMPSAVLLAQLYDILAEAVDHRRIEKLPSSFHLSFHHSEPTTA